MFRRILLSMVFCSVAGCSGTLYVYKENFRLFFKSSETAIPDRAYVTASKFDIAQVSFADKRAIMALAFVEHGQDKFISADNGFLIFQRGRIVRSAGFIDNLQYVHNLQQDPLQLSYQQLDSKQWDFVLQSDSQPAIAAKAQFNQGSPQALSLLDGSINTVLVEESVEVTGGPDFVNQYWFDAQSGDLLQTVQHLPNLAEPVTVVFLSRANRVLINQQDAR